MSNPYSNDLRCQPDHFAPDVDLNSYTKLPQISQPEFKQANLGSFPTPARAIAAGKSGSYAVTSATSSSQPRNYVVTAAVLPAVADLFADFDRLRSNFVPATQFRRCIGAILHKGVASPLTEAEVETLMAYYDVRNNKMIKWTSFVDSIDKVFGAKRLESNPSLQAPDPKDAVKLLIVVKNLRTLSPTSECLLQSVIERLRAYVKSHGSDVKTWFNDFDKHNNGFITINQFRRGIPANLLSMKEQDLLVEQYSSNYSVNYFKLNTDVNRKVRRPANPESTNIIAQRANPEYRTHFVPVGTEELIYPPKTQYKQFGPTGDEFRAGLRLASLELKEVEIKSLLGVYQERDGRVRYRDFSDSIEQGFETRLTFEHYLPAEDESRCQQILDRLHGLVSERHLLFEPFFKDYDKYLGQCIIGRVTRSHFQRLLSSMKLDLSERDLHILFAKFEHEDAPDQINYGAFIWAVDPETHLTPQPPPKDAPPTLASLLHTLRTFTLKNRIRISEFFRDADKLRSYSIPRAEFIRGVHRMGVPGVSSEASDILADAYADSAKVGCCKWKNFEEDIERVFGETHLEGRPAYVPTTLLEQPDPFLTESTLEYNEESKLADTLNMIRNFLRVRQTCVKPFFKDFDKLRTGYVTKAQFRQTLSYIRCPISEDEFTTLSKRYLKASGPGEAQANWTSGTAPQDGGDYISDRARRICYVAFLRELEEGMPVEMREQTGTFVPARAARLFVPTTSTSNGRVQPDQDWKWTEKLPAAESEKFVSGYTRVVKTPIIRAANIERWPLAQDSYFGVGYPLRAGETLPMTYNEVTKLIMMIKTKTKTERIRIVDCMSDFDHLRHNKISTTEFQRCLKLLYPSLVTRELDTLSRLYQENGDNAVSYSFFADEIDAVFTKKGLERTPLAEPEVFPEPGSLPARERETGVVVRDEEQVVLDAVMKRLREAVKVRRIEVLGYLEDFDDVNEGTITTNQLRSVLTNAGLPVEDGEIWVLAKKYASTRTLERVDYRAFARALTQ
ncbi:hypothetical protein BDZ88DRAFT_444259 [Geranomyces variabilis]|nr:hypothetical protein BDZ88DRAFT_444259 [Geranomyces variabilis]